MGVIMAMDFRSQVELPVAASSNKEAMRKQEFDAGLATKQDKAPTGGANAGKTLGVKDGAWVECAPSNMVTTNTVQELSVGKTFRTNVSIVDINTDTTDGGISVKNNRYVSTILPSVIRAWDGYTSDEFEYTSTGLSGYRPGCGWFSIGIGESWTIDTGNASGMTHLRINALAGVWGTGTTANTKGTAGKLVVTKSGTAGANEYIKADGTFATVSSIDTSAFITTNNPNKTAITEGFRLTNTVNANWRTEYGSLGMKVILVTTERAGYTSSGVFLRDDLGGVAQYYAYGFRYADNNGGSEMFVYYTEQGTGGFHGSGTTAPSTTSGPQVNAGVFAIIPNSTSADNKTYGFKNQRIVEIIGCGKSVPVTIAPSSWQNTGNGYEYNHAIANLDASQEVELRLPSPTTRANYNAFTAAKLIVSGTGSSPGQVTINADTGASAPGTAITVLLKYHEL